MASWGQGSAARRECVARYVKEGVGAGVGFRACVYIDGMWLTWK